MNYRTILFHKYCSYWLACALIVGGFTYVLQATATLKSNGQNDQIVQLSALTSPSFSPTTYGYFTTQTSDTSTQFNFYASNTNTTTSDITVSAQDPYTLTLNTPGIYRVSADINSISNIQSLILHVGIQPFKTTYNSMDPFPEITHASYQQVITVTEPSPTSFELFPDNGSNTHITGSFFIYRIDQ